MTALQVIKRIKSLPLRERRKVLKYLQTEAEPVPNAATRRALREDLSKARRFGSVDALLADLKQ